MSGKRNPVQRLSSRIFRKLFPGPLGYEVCGELEQGYLNRRATSGDRFATLWYVGHLLTPSTWALAFKLRSRPKAARGAGNVGASSSLQSRSVGTRRAGILGLHGSLLDFKLGVRMMVKYPGLSLVCVIATSFAIAGGAGTFEFIYQMVYPTLPLHEGERVVAIENWDAEANEQEFQILHDFATWREEYRSVEELGIHQDIVRNLSIEGGPARPVLGAEISASGFRLARVPPLLGRTLVEADEQAGAPAVIVIGYDVWQTSFSGDPDIIGRTLRVADSPSTVVGVMPEKFAFPVYHSFWTPLQLDVLAFERRQGPAVHVFGRLAPGVSLDEAQVELTSIGARSAANYPDTHQHLRPVVKPYALSFFDVTESRLKLNAMNLLGVMILVLICCNVALLLFARAATRESEIVVRNALGASRGRIITQIFIEALVLGGVAAAVGLVVASFGLRLLRGTIQGASEGAVPFWVDFSLSPATVLYAVLLTLLGSVIAGVVPALKITRGAATSLRQAGYGGSSNVRFGMLWTVVVVIQVAVTVVCPVWAFFAWQDMVRYQSVGVGFPEEEYLTVRLEMDQVTPSGTQAKLGFYERFLETAQELERRVTAEPNVTGVTFARQLPHMPHPFSRIEMDEAAVPIPGSEIGYRVTSTSIDLEFFDVLGVPILSGRGFHSDDLESDHGVVIVNQSFVDGVLEGRNPIGRRLRNLHFQESSMAWSPDDESGPWYEIVGVVRDIGGANTTIGRGQFYRPMAPGTTYPIHMAVHLRGAPESFGARLRDVATAVNPSLRLHRLLPLNEIGEAEVDLYRLAAQLSIIASSIAVLLSLAGIYSVMSFTVSRRTREIGIRVALGSGRRRVVAAILSRPLVKVTIGVVVGSALATGMVHEAVVTAGSENTMGWTLVLVVAYGALTMGVCLLACIVPARRALRVQPTEALRAE